MEDQALVSFVLNSVVSRSDINYAVGQLNSPIQTVWDGRLIRVDLNVLCPFDGGKDLLETQKIWDGMFNPYFLLEKQASARVAGRRLHRRVEVEPYVADDGKTYDYEYQDVDVETLLDEARVFGPHIDVDAGAGLQAHTLSQNPIVWCQSLYSQALTSADGGLYYKFMDIQAAPVDKDGKKTQSDQEFWLSRLGVSEDLVDTLRADQRVAMARSNVTAKPRRIDVFNRPSRSGNNQGLIAITQDMFDADYDTAADPLLNLLEFEAAGREVLFERNNGHIGYILFDGDGNLVAEAPPQLVTDHTIPSPHTARLQAAISCIRCHGVGEDQGWKPFDNDVKQATDSFMNVYGEQSADRDGLTIAETLQKLARLYSGSLDKPIRRAKEDHVEAIIRSVAGTAVKEDGTPWDFKDVSAALAERFAYYDYTPVTPQKASLELGYRVDDDQAAVAKINEVLGLLEADRSTGIIPEDVRMGLLKMNIPINRFQWELIYADAAMRAAANSN